MRGLKKNTSGRDIRQTNRHRDYQTTSAELVKNDVALAEINCGNRSWVILSSWSIFYRKITRSFSFFLLHILTLVSYQTPLRLALGRWPLLPVCLINYKIVQCLSRLKDMFMLVLKLTYLVQGLIYCSVLLVQQDKKELAMYFPTLGNNASDHCPLKVASQDQEGQHKLCNLISAATTKSITYNI